MSENRRSTKIILSVLSALSAPSVASTPGAPPFGFFRNSRYEWRAIGGYRTETTAFSTSTVVQSGSSDTQLNLPYGQAADATNKRLYTADSNNHRIVVSNSETGAVIGAIGRTSASTGTCPSSGAASGWCTGGTFISGSGDGMFNGPRDVAVDVGNNRLYIGDAGNHRVVLVNASTGAFIGAIGNLASSSGSCPASGTAAGWCAGGAFASAGVDGAFSSPTGMAVDSGNDFLYVTDSGNHRIVKIVASTGAFVGAIGRSTATSGTCAASGSQTGWCTGGTFALGADDGMLSSPFGISIDQANGRLFVADAGNSRITRFSLSSGSFVGAVGRTTATSGTCAASGSQTGWCTGGTFGSGAADGQFAAPADAEVDADNDRLFVSDPSNHRVQIYVSSTGAFIGALGRMTASTGTCPSSGTALGWCTGGTAGVGSLNGQFNMAWGLAFDEGQDRLYVGEASGHRIQALVASSGAYIGTRGGAVRLTATGWVAQTTATTAGSTDGIYNVVRDVVLDPARDRMYLVDSNNHRIVKAKLSTGAFIGAIGRTSSSTGTCPASGAASGWCTGGAFASGASDGMFNTPSGASFDSSNNILFVADSANFRIVKINADTGAFVGAIGNLSASSGTCPASGAATGWCTGGTFATGASDGMFAAPASLAFDSSNSILFATDNTNKRVSSINAGSGAYIGSIGRTTATSGTCPASGAATGWCTGGTFASGTGDGMFAGLAGVFFDGANDRLFVADSTNRRVVLVTASTGAFVGAVGRVTATSGTCPSSGSAPGWCTGGTFANGTGDGAFGVIGGLEADVAANVLYVADATNNRIVAITASTGAFIGATGRTTASSGTCPASGTALTWCTGGTFAVGSASGQFAAPISVRIDALHKHLFIADGNNSRVQRRGL